MKDFVKTLITLLSSVIFFVACEEKEDLSKGTACDILTFKIGETEWTVGDTTITMIYPSAILPTPLKPTITLSPGATVNPPSGQEQNNFFKDGGVRYIVTAEDRVTTKTYTARAIRTKYTGCEILSFIAGGVVWNIDGSLITCNFPSTTTVTSLSPIIELSPGAKISPLPIDAQDFFTEQGVEYTVTSEDGNATKTYTVKARKKSANCDILSFVVDGREWRKNNDVAINLVYPEETEPGMLTPIIEVSPGAKVDPPSNVPQNFFTESGVKYTVKAEDTAVTKIYTVKAIRALDCEITMFRAGGVEWQINKDELLITYTFQAGTSTGYLLPSITSSPNATLVPSSTDLQNFFVPNGVQYTVTGESGQTRTYTVKAFMFKKYQDMSNWVVWSRNGNHNWGDGKGTQTLWSGGCPMLIIDDDLESGWHSTIGAQFPHVLVIDMKGSKKVSKVTGSGNDLNNMELYLTDNLSIANYEPHTVNWGDDTWREYDYNAWRNSYGIPETPPASWGSLIAKSAAVAGATFSLIPSETVQGRFLIIRLIDNTMDWGATYTAIRNIEVYYSE